MAKIVIDISKDKGGTGAKLDAHLERTYIARNVDQTRTGLNRVLIAPTCGSRRAAVEQRIAGAGIRRKIQANAVKSVNIVLSGSHEKMKSLEEEGRLDDWAADSVEWLRRTFGDDNVVSAYLHCDERTPHIHACVVPIVTKKSKKNGENVASLSARDVLQHNNYEKYWTSYAKSMKKYGLERGDKTDRDIATDELVDFYHRAKKIDKKELQKAEHLVNQAVEAEAKIAKASSMSTNVAAFISTAAATAGRKLSGQRQREVQEHQATAAELAKSLADYQRLKEENQKLRQQLQQVQQEEAEKVKEAVKNAKEEAKFWRGQAKAWKDIRQGTGEQQEQTKSRGR